MKIADIKPEVYEMAKRAELRLGERFREIDAVSEQNTRKIMQAFQNHRVSDACFAGTTGYGYDDLGRETLDKIYGGDVRAGETGAEDPRRHRHAV